MQASPLQLGTSTLLAAALHIPLAGAAQSVVEPTSRQMAARDSRSWWIGGTCLRLPSAEFATSTSIPFRVGQTVVSEAVDRLTTAQEQLIGEIREWALLDKNWDGEGASIPDERSLRDAADFATSLSPIVPVPVPMLHASGKAGLYWDENGLYADLEFLGDGRVTYYVEKNGHDRHKGVVSLRQGEMPTVFATLLRT